MSKLSEARRRVSGMGMAEAQEELKTLRRRLFDLRLQLARGEVKNNRQFQQTKKEIARLMFHLSELNRAEDGDVSDEDEVAEQPAASAPTEESK